MDVFEKVFDRSRHVAPLNVYMSLELDQQVSAVWNAISIINFKFPLFNVPSIISPFVY
jgi:hypothetical protein